NLSIGCSSRFVNKCSNSIGFLCTVAVVDCFVASRTDASPLVSSLRCGCNSFLASCESRAANKHYRVSFAVYNRLRLLGSIVERALAFFESLYSKQSRQAVERNRVRSRGISRR